MSHPSAALSSVSQPPDKTRRRTAFGPGAIFALAVIGAGDFVSNTAIGAIYGTALLWTLLVAAICRYVWVECCARYVLVTGETPFTGFARVSRILLWIVLLTLILHRHIHGLGHVVYMGLSIHLVAPLPLAASSAVWSLLFVGVGFSMMFWSGYRTLERMFKLLMALMAAALIAVVFMVPPSIPAVLRGLFIPSLPAAEGPYSAVLLLTALLGTEACSLSNITYSYFMWQKGWRDISYSARQRSDLLYGIGAMFMTGVFLQIASAGTIGRGGVAPQNVEDLVRIFSDQLGVIGRLAFVFGIWAAVFTSFIGGIRGYSLAIADVVRSLGLYESRAFSASQSEARRDPLVRGLMIFFAFSPLYILYTSVRPIPLMLAASSFSVIAIPIVSFALLRLTSDKRIMGEYRNHWISNLILAFVGTIACFFIYKNVEELWARFSPAAGS
jgi:Mn2+/Fe2+ NRAMP family transporter